jgi:hypothetical protein
MIFHGLKIASIYGIAIALAVGKTLMEALRPLSGRLRTGCIEIGGSSAAERPGADAVWRS